MNPAALILALILTGCATQPRTPAAAPATRTLDLEPYWWVAKDVAEKYAPPPQPPPPPPSPLKEALTLLAVAVVTGLYGEIARRRERKALLTPSPNDITIVHTAKEVPAGKTGMD